MEDNDYKGKKRSGCLYKRQGQDACGPCIESDEYETEQKKPLLMERLMRSKSVDILRNKEPTGEVDAAGNQADEAK